LDRETEFVQEIGEIGEIDQIPDRTSYLLIFRLHSAHEIVQTAPLCKPGQETCPFHGIALARGIGADQQG